MRYTSEVYLDGWNKKATHHFFFMLRRDVSDVVPPGDHLGVSSVAENGVQRVDELSSIVFGQLRRRGRRGQEKNGEKADRRHLEKLVSGPGK